MPKTNSVKKRIRKNEKKRKSNRYYKIKMRNKIKELLSIEDKAEAKEMMSDVVSLIDKVAQKGIIPDNRAARKKSKLANHISNLS